MNLIELRGRLTKDPEIRGDEGSKSIRVSFMLAVTDYRKRKAEGKGYEADFIPMVAFGSIAENLEKYCHKGSEIIVVGRLHSYKRDESFCLQVIADNIEFIGGSAASKDNVEEQNIGNEDLPFN